MTTPVGGVLGWQRCGLGKKFGFRPVRPTFPPFSSLVLWVRGHEGWLLGVPRSVLPTLLIIGRLCCRRQLPQAHSSPRVCDP